MPRKKISSEYDDDMVAIRTRKKRYADDEDDFITRGADRVNKQFIERPQPANGRMEKFVIWIVAIIFVGALFGGLYLMFHKNNNSSPTTSNRQSDNVWYAIKLIDGEVFYGQIADVKADPLLVSNVYYDYDQLKAKEDNKPVEELSTNLRLVKRGKETHGPEGIMNIVRAQVLYMEPLKADSKVLQAIAEYEKK